MTAAIPPQRNRCPVYGWCTATGRRHDVHTGETYLVTTERGVELRISLGAEGGRPAAVQMEAAFEPTGALLQLAELSVSEALELARACLRLARIAQREGNEIH